MKNKILQLIIIGMLIYSAGLAQTQKSQTNKDKTLTKNTDHIGTWKLVSQKITYENGQIVISDSASIFLRKILTPTNFVVIAEKKVPELNNKKLAAVVSGGTYLLVNGNYQEFTKYASFKGFEDIKVNYKLTLKDGRIHTIGTSGGPQQVEEIYERVAW